MTWLVLPASLLAAALTTWALTGFLVRGLSRRGLVDTPNERSSHTQPKPRGGGLVLIPAILISWYLVILGVAPLDPGLGLVPILIGAAGLAALGWIDDLRDLPAAARLLAQAAAVALGLIGMDGAGLFFQGLLPPFLDRLAAGLAWMWVINLFNFMDGIDGIAGVETVSIGAGLAMIGALGGLAGLDPRAAIFLPALLAAATLGFLAWNWPPAKLFLGDVGSVPLGYLLGWLLLVWAAEGQWAAALILPLYYLADATITLARRAVRGAKVWQAHREHFYQRAVRGRASHGQVTRGVLACNVLLMACTALAVYSNPWIGLTLAVGIVGGFLAVLRRWARPAV
jgi:UDP-N-acetylmuramyl pentapeptide phosphotransferase/UDP-N-acetylglucosamine-1-phosphate transferase